MGGGGLRRVRAGSFRKEATGHVNANGVRAAPLLFFFQPVTVNLFDLSLCKSLRGLKASLLDCAGNVEGEEAGGGGRSFFFFFVPPRRRR